MFVSKFTIYIILSCHTFGDEFCPEELRNFSTYRNWFNMPDSIGPNLWYSFNLGPVHFVFINTESDFPGAPSFPGKSRNLLDILI